MNRKPTSNELHRFFSARGWTERQMCPFCQGSVLSPAMPSHLLEKHMNEMGDMNKLDSASAGRQNQEEAL